MIWARMRGHSSAEEALALMGEQLFARAGGDEHAHAAAALDDAEIDQRVIGAGDGQRIDAEVGGDAAHGGQRFALAGGLVQDHLGYPLPDLDEDRLGFVEMVICVRFSVLVM